jgi:hypothetical protein
MATIIGIRRICKAGILHWREGKIWQIVPKDI